MAQNNLNTLTIEVSSIGDYTGQIIMSLFDSKASFLKQEKETKAMVVTKEVGVQFIV